MSYSHNDNKGISFESKLDSLFKCKTGGFYIELGANDGLIQSNTAFLEKERHWTGVLIEPSLNAYEKCVINRPKSRCINAACVDSSYTNKYVYGDFNGDLMSSIDGKRLSNPVVTQVCVRAKTLEAILDDCGCDGEIDLLSLDTEGFELQVLDGLNLCKYRPRYMLIEIYKSQYNDLISMLQKNKYSLVENFSNYNSVDNPQWDGTHNDYLFKDDLCNSI